MLIDWDDDKERLNIRKHRIDFTTAKEVFSDPDVPGAAFDAEHSTEDEERWRIIGPTSRGLLLVVFAFRIGDVIWIISARRATRLERNNFYNQ